MASRDFFDARVHAELLERVGRLSAETVPGWGRMNAAQMCAHCAEVLEVAEGKPLVGTPLLVRLIGPLIKKMVVSDRPYPKGSRTHPQYVIPDSVEFEGERDRLVTVIDRVYAAGRERAEGTRHPLFGKMTADEVSTSMYKHLDHHLTQFGV